MILRRLRAHVEAENWFAVAIDFAIVVIGVFIGVQAANWNADRVTMERASAFAERLRADLLEEAWSYEHLIAYNRDVLRHAERTVDALSGRAALDDEALLISAYRTTQYRFLERRRATYDELVSTGDIGLISDASLRRTAVQVFTNPVPDLITDEGHVSVFRRMFRERVPAPVQRALLDRCGERVVEPLDYDGIVASLDYPCELGLPEPLLVEAAASLRGDDAVLRAARVRFADVETALADLKGNNRGVREQLLRLSERADTPHAAGQR